MPRERPPNSRSCTQPVSTASYVGTTSRPALDNAEPAPRYVHARRTTDFRGCLITPAVEYDPPTSCRAFLEGLNEKAEQRLYYGTVQDGWIIAVGDRKLQNNSTFYIQAGAICAMLQSISTNCFTPGTLPGQRSSRKNLIFRRDKLPRRLMKGRSTQLKREN